MEEIKRESTNGPSVEDILGGVTMGEGVDNDNNNVNIPTPIADNPSQQSESQVVEGQLPPQGLSHNKIQGRKFTFYDLFILVGIIIFLFVFFTLIYSLQGDFLSLVIGLILTLVLIKGVLIKKSGNNLVFFLGLIYLILYLYFMNSSISYWLFVGGNILLISIMFILTYYTSISLHLSTTDTQQEKKVDNIGNNNGEDMQENNEEDEVVQLGEDIVQQYEDEFTEDVDTTITNEIIDKVIAYIQQGYLVLFSPNSRKIFEFYKEENRKEVILPLELIGENTDLSKNDELISETDYIEGQEINDSYNTDNVNNGEDEVEYDDNEENDNDDWERNNWDNEGDDEEEEKEEDWDEDWDEEEKQNDKNTDDDDFDF